MSQKRISISTLKIGMFVCGLDRSWLHTPFFTHRFLIQDHNQIEKLKQCGIQEVEIDTARGLDAPRVEPTSPLPDTVAVPPPLNEPSAAPPHAETPEPQELEGMSAGRQENRSPWMMARDLSAVRDAREQLLKEVNVLLHTISEAAPVKSDQVRTVVCEIIAKTLANQAAFLALVRVRDFDAKLHDHLLSVSTLSAIVGNSLHYPPAQLEHLVTGALLHDVGLLRLPHYMCRLPQSLKKAERALYESHPRLGATLLQRNGGFHDDVVTIVSEHHGTAGEENPAKIGKHFSEAGRLVMILDRYDELLTGQTEPVPLPPRQALSRLYQEAQADRLDQPLVEHLVRVIGVYPLYSLVALETGEHGIVTAITPGKLHQPVLAVFRGPNGETYSPPRILDLSKREECSIVGALDVEAEGINLEAILVQCEPALAGKSEGAPASE
jgi:putative nucleotidyltransferase with HDIG domain